MNENIRTYYEVTRAKNLVKLKRYCAYRDRCHKEVSDKLSELKVDSEMIDDIISTLITEGYLNEERFVLAYVRGKFRMNKWGKSKIIRELKHRQITQFLINKGLKEIDDEQYFETLKNLIIAKSKTFKAKNQYDKHHKLYSYAYRKGYESELINMAIEEIINY